MGLLDIVPGVSGAKTAIGVAIGGLVGYFTGKYSSSKELKLLKTKYDTLEEEVKDLRSRLGTADENRLRRALLKVAILRQLAWKDGVLDYREKLFLHDFVLEHPDLPADYKIQFMQEINRRPEAIEGYWQYIKMNYQSHLYGSSEEKLGFKAVLLQLAHIDGEYSPAERVFIAGVLKACDLPPE